MLLFAKIDNNDINSLYNYFFVMGFLSLFIAFLSGFFSGHELIARLETDKLNPITLGHLAATCMMMAIFRFFENEKSKYLILFFIFSLSVLLFANSKAPILAFFLTALFYFLSRNKKGIIYIILMGLGVLLIVVYILPYFNDIFHIDILARFTGMSSAYDESTVTRKISMLNAIELFEDNPIFGSSIVTSSGGYPHNITLETLMALGVVGGLTFFLLVLFSLVICYRLISKNSKYSLISLFYIQYLFGIQTSGAIWNSTSFWAAQVLLLSIYLAITSYKED
ncbi:TPA: O-antigen ligase family protein [Photobacterium damselae]